MNFFVPIKLVNDLIRMVVNLLFENNLHVLSHGHTASGSRYAKKPDNLLRCVMSIVSKNDTGRVLRVYILSFSIMNYVSIWSIDQKNRQQKKKNTKKAEKKIIIRESIHTHTYILPKKEVSLSLSRTRTYINKNTYWFSSLARERKKRRTDEAEKRRKRENTQRGVICWKMQ